MILRNLVEEIAVSPANQIIVNFYRRLSDFGPEGIRALAPVIADDARRHSVVLMIREIAKAGAAERSAACETLVTGLADVRPTGQAFMIEALTDIPCEMPDAVFPAGTRYVPIAGGVTAHHAVIDVVRDSKTTFGPLYLTACHWVFSFEWVDKHGGLAHGHGGRYCYFCARALGDGSRT